ncbi:MAG: TonB-dependent receptor [Bacteroidota bacterium]
MIHFTRLLCFALIFISMSMAHAQNREAELKDTSITQVRNAVLFELPTVALTDDDLSDADANQDFSGLLNSADDVFLSVAAFPFGVARFRMRGYDAENTTALINGIPINDLDNGRFSFATFGGLNDVTRQRQTFYGIGANDYTFGGIGGGIHINTFASDQWEQTRVSYSVANRSYRNRLMLTHSTGMLPSGWAFSFSASRRWAQEGYVEGTFYDAYSYFASVDRKIGNKQLLNLTFFGARNRRGKTNSAIQEVYDLAGSNFYNPNWGFQEGKKRNARIGDTHKPIAILQHKWDISRKTSLNTSVAYQFGKDGGTALDWFNTSDPRPDYYQKLPSFASSEASRDRITQIFQDNPEKLQLDWEQFYDVNRNNLETINGETGNFSQYIIEDRRFDARIATFNTVLNHQLTDRIALTGGALYQHYTKENYKTVVDLLGGDYYLNWDRFAERDAPGDDQIKQLDINNPDRILREGDRWGYDYDLNIRKTQAWGQTNISLSKIDLFASARVTNTQFWRTGNFRSGRFPENSFGDAERQNFNNFSLKAGATYKLDGKNFLYANGFLGTRAPFARFAYQAPRTRNDLVTDNLISEKIMSGEAGYILKAPKLKARASIYYARFADQIQQLSFYNDIARQFGYFVYEGVNKRHAGTELAFEYQLPYGFELSAATSLGQYLYDGRPTYKIVQDNNRSVLETGTLYINEFFVPATPQRAGTVGLMYRSPKYWFIAANANFFDQNYSEFNPIRRTERAVKGLDPVENADLIAEITEQEQLPAAFTLDVFAYKSIKVKDYFVYLSLGVNNILNNQDFITSGREQLRINVLDTGVFDVNRFEPRYFYAYGLNYFANLSFRF